MLEQDMTEEIFTGPYVKRAYPAPKQIIDKAQLIL
jgi:hypothetical protein